MRHASRGHDEHLLILSGRDGGLLALSEGLPPPESPRTTHFGFELTSAEDVRDARERFARAGVTEAEWQERVPTRLQVFDPDGYRVELYAL